MGKTGFLYRTTVVGGSKQHGGPDLGLCAQERLGQRLELMGWV